MRLNRMILPVGALAIALGAGGLSAEAAQRGDRRDRGGNESQGQARARSSDARNNDSAAREQRGNERSSRGEDRVQRNDQRDSRRDVQIQRNDLRDRRGDDRGWRGDDRLRQSDRRDGYRYSAPRVVVPRRQAFPHYYGSGGRLSVYFGLGSGYRYGSPYYGRVYGYLPPSAGYGSRGYYYGDVRLQVRPRGAAVYVDGYYAGIVDDFDGVFQRLTLAVGPHEIEIEAPGFEPQVFNVYVDPTRTVDLHGDLYPERP
jgi:hypothetical protein